jgi:tetratricopeptide (TPR) repeat protein
MDPPAVEPDEPLGAENEAQWDRLRTQLELAESFWLGFVFSPAPRSAAVLRRRVERVLRRDHEPLLLIQPATPVDLRGALLRLVNEDDPARAGCVWVEAVRSDSLGAKQQPWTAAWDELFLRANVRRDLLRRRLPGGLVFAAPPEIKPRVREAAPDLWSVRSLVIDVAAVRVPVDPAKLVLPALEMVTGPAPDPAFALAEAARRGEHGATRSQARALVQAAEGLLAKGKAREARDAALKAWELLEGEGGMGEAESLAMLARADEADQDYAAAMDHIERAIAMSRRINSGTVPMLWYTVAGTVATCLRDGVRAESIYAQAEPTLRARLANVEAFDDLFELAYLLGARAWLKHSAGDLDAALALSEEATLLVRRLVALFPHPAGYGMLRFSLKRLAWILRTRGDEAAALAAEEEAASLAPQPSPPP